MAFVRDTIDDSRYILRHSRRNPTFLVGAVLLIALASGGHITALSLLNAVSWA